MGPIPRHRKLRQVEVRRLDARREPRVGSAAGEPHAAARRAAEEMDRRPLEGYDRRARRDLTGETLER